MNLKNNIPLQLLICFVFAVFFGKKISNEHVCIAYTLSVLIKDLLMHFLPILVFSYIVSALSSFRSKGISLVFLALFFVCISNALTVIFGYGVSLAFLPNLITSKNSINPNITLPNESLNIIKSLWELPIKQLIPTDKTMLFGAIAGLILGIYPVEKISNTISKLRNLSTNLFKKIFTPLLPLFIFGFLLKMSKDGSLESLLKQYTTVFIFTFACIVIYLLFLYLIASKGKIKDFKIYIKNIIPAGITGFSTVSSAATMPITIQSTENNIKNSNYANFIIPSTVNVHLIGDGIAISITALAIMFINHSQIPDFSLYINFVLYYCLAKFSCAGVPGGGVLVLIPVFQQYLNMSNETATVIASIYMLQDPIITSANVMGNGAFAIITHRIAKCLKLI